ncbi:hypothetical protein BBJ28_00005857 [Nothophytophthora sp. Chile5]|nr:hypothetical protein BBJ28_00005857 [Nothophytophthora sp. Chile5]
MAKAKRKAPIGDEPATTKRVTRSSAAAVDTAADGIADAKVAATSSSIQVSATPAKAGRLSTKKRSSSKTVVFLRGVNVSGRVHSMKSIAEALDEAGFANVTTFLASGNVLFDSLLDDEGAATALVVVERQVEDTLEELFGSRIPVFARSLDDVAQLGQRIVKTATAVNVVLLKDELTSGQRETLKALSTDANELELLGKAFVWYSATKMSESPLFKVSFEKKLGVPVTVRNVNTLRRIVAKFG